MHSRFILVNLLIPFVVSSVCRIVEKMDECAIEAREMDHKTIFPTSITMQYCDLRDSIS